MTNVTDILDSDIKIMDNSKREQKDGKTYLTFNLGIGKPMVGEFPEQLDRTLVESWCNTLRREFNARQASQAAKSASAVNAAKGAPKRDDPAATQPGGGGVSAPTTIQALKKQMEEDLKSQVASVRQEAERIRERCSEYHDVLAQAEARLNELNDMETYLTAQLDLI